MGKAAILIDGAYFLNRLPYVRRDMNASDPKDVVRAVAQLVRSHLDQLNQVHRYPSMFRLLYRCYYYDAAPYENKGHLPVSNRAIDYARSPVAKFRRELFDLLRQQPNLALRLGRVSKPQDRSWVLKARPQARLLKGELVVSDLDDSDFSLHVRQKGVDMRVGLDIATIALKKQADSIVLVSGDSDFVPAAKLARREGVTFVLDPLWQNVSPDLAEHIDKLTSGFQRPRSGET